MVRVWARSDLYMLFVLALVFVFIIGTFLWMLIRALLDPFRHRFSKIKE